VLSAIVSLAETLKIDVTAEGVETLDELELVRELGCTDIQGFLFGRPITAEDALRLAEDSRSMSAKDVEPRAPRHSLIRRAALRLGAGTLPVRLRNISAEGAMIESGDAMQPGSDVELDVDGIRLEAEVRWSQDGRTGLRFAESFDLRRLGSARRKAQAGILLPDYLRSELDPESPWAARKERLTVKEVKAKRGR